MKKIIVVGGGAAGMMAAITAAENGCEVVLFEKNDRLGKKLFITGKGRCNLTNAGDADRFFQSVTTNSKFMYSPFYTFDNQMTIDFFEKLGLKTKVERGDRVFPVSDHSSDVIGVLKTKLNRNQEIIVELQTEVQKLIIEDQVVKGVQIKTAHGKKDVYGDAVVITTGGISYPLTGSTGDGYRFAESAGHTIKELLPSLVPFELKGELLFTHFGISGPLVIKASAYLHKYLDKDLSMYIDLKPAMTEEMLDDRILRDFSKYANKDFHNSLGDLLPVIKRPGIDPYKKVNSITKEERKNLVTVLKQFTLSFRGLRGFEEAIITKGGVNVKEVVPSTMQSKLVDHLYFAGEVLDVDALTGGFNLQIAWSTGYLAGLACSEGSN